MSEYLGVDTSGHGEPRPSPGTIDIFHDELKSLFNYLNKTCKVFLPMAQQRNDSFAFSTSLIFDRILEPFQTLLLHDLMETRLDVTITFLEFRLHASAD